MRWLAIYLPLLPLEWERQDQLPRALLDAQARRIVLANRPARLAGIEQGVALATAHALCPELETQIDDEQQTLESLQSLALEVGRWSARISCVNSSALLAEVASMERYFKGLEPLVDAVCEMLSEQHLSYQLGMALTPGAALALSRIDSPVAFSEQEIDRQILSLPVSVLQLKLKECQALQSLGLTQVGMLEKLPRSEIGSRFSPELLLCLDQLRGRVDWVPEAFIPPELFEQRVDLQAEINYAQGLLFPLRRLLGRLEGFLHLRQQYALVLCIELKHRDLSSDQIKIGHAGGCYRASDWMALLHLKLENYRLTQPVIELKLSVNQFRGWDAPAQDLFDPVSADESPEQLLSRIQIRLGKAAISYLSVPETHFPLLQTKHSSEPVLDLLPCIRRPLWLLETPERLSASQVSSFRVQQGPERMQTQWWQRMGLRDYFIVRWPDGRQAWVFRDQCQHWFLHGWYG